MRRRWRVCRLMPRFYPAQPCFAAQNTATHPKSPSLDSRRDPRPTKVAPAGPDGAAAATKSPSASTAARQKRSSPPPAGEGLAGPPSVGLVRYPRLVPKDAQCAKELKKRTLTNLYNQRPAWLDLAHQKLAAAVFAAYAWPPTLTDDELLAKLLDLNLSRATT